MRATKKIAEGMSVLGKTVRQAKRSIVNEAKSAGDTLGRKTSGVRRSLRRLAKKSIKIGR